MDLELLNEKVIIRFCFIPDIKIVKLLNQINTEFYNLLLFLILFIIKFNIAELI